MSKVLVRHKIFKTSVRISSFIQFSMLYSSWHWNNVIRHWKLHHLFWLWVQIISIHNELWKSGTCFGQWTVTSERSAEEKQRKMEQ